MYSKSRVSIKRVCNYLIRNGRSELFMVDTSGNNKLFFESCNKAVTIYMGELRVSHGVNKMNNGGLLLKLENKKNILMPGDCENQVIQNIIVNNQYDNVLVPHHGAIMSNPTLWGKKGKKTFFLPRKGQFFSCFFGEKIRYYLTDKPQIESNN